jgi:hypothetical protein
MKAFILTAALVTGVFTSVPSWASAVYNECVDVNNPKNGIYFEHVLAQPSPNASERTYQYLHVVKGDKRYAILMYLKYVAVRSDCADIEGSEPIMEFNLPKTAYARYRRVMKCSEIDVSDGTTLDRAMMAIDLNGSRAKFRLEDREKGLKIDMTLKCK